MKLSVGFSPCPNDTFIFDALVNNKIDTGDFIFDVILEDVQTLNNWALEGRLDITKLSYGVLPLVLKQYIITKSGSALGKRACSQKCQSAYCHGCKCSGHVLTT